MTANIAVLVVRQTSYQKAGQEKRLSPCVFSLKVKGRISGFGRRTWPFFRQEILGAFPSNVLPREDLIPGDYRISTPVEQKCYASFEIRKDVIHWNGGVGADVAVKGPRFPSVL